MNGLIQRVEEPTIEMHYVSASQYRIFFAEINQPKLGVKAEVNSELLFNGVKKVPQGTKVTIWGRFPENLVQAIKEGYRAQGIVVERRGLSAEVAEKTKEKVESRGPLTVEGLTEEFPVLSAEIAKEVLSGSIEDLTTIEGIGAARAAKIAEFIALAPSVELPEEE